MLCYTNQIHNLDKKLSKRFCMYISMYHIFLPFEKILGRHTRKYLFIFSNGLSENFEIHKSQKTQNRTARNTLEQITSNFENRGSRVVVVGPPHGKSDPFYSLFPHQAGYMANDHVVSREG